MAYDDDKDRLDEEKDIPDGAIEDVFGSEDEDEDESDNPSESEDEGEKWE